MPWTMTITGVTALTKTLETLPDAIAGAVLLEALASAAEPMAERMRELAPRGPVAPHLADSILVAPIKSDAVSAEVQIGPTRHFFYGKFWEFGWKYHAARPFVRPAYDAEAWPTLDRFGRELWRAITTWVDGHVEIAA